MNEKSTVCVVGSINMDLTVSTSVIPNQGETVLGESFATYPGGKGANQAVAAARLGSHVKMVGAVGHDVFGISLKEHLQKEGIDTSSTELIPEQSTGTATIILSNNDNRIIVAPGANRSVTPSYVEKHRAAIEESDIILLQMEIPIETISYVVTIAKELNISVILNPAPYQPLPAAILNQVDYMTPNALEAELFKNDLIDDDLLEKWITTKGEQGSSLYVNGKEVHIPGYPVPVKDTTGAGDTFNGALATQLAQGISIKKAVSFANAAAALSVTEKGAQGGMPTLGEVENFLKERSDEI
ncbi:ribokinase [Halobacillus andaensis]|uniref:Ribokinase n=1 Tax=Halobacillus andaensis TaxID=1176239 RepID=A0A917EVP3_HALAA|nr:ribokinase [Halobacillus andaensis]MBP2004786.1 ribokinase [Halobacillus andaensis]GGF18899.1 ribokinase [Halobacillus andaensis]